MKHSLITEADDDGMIVRFTYEVIHPSDVYVPDENMEKVKAAVRSASLAASKEFKRAMEA